MPTIYPESLLEDLVAAFIPDVAEADGRLEEITNAARVFKGFDAIKLETPALIVGVGQSSPDEVGNFVCELNLGLRRNAKEDNIRATQTEAEAELRDICQGQDIENLLNSKASSMGIPLRVQFFEPTTFTRSADEGDFISTQAVEVTVYFD